VTVVLVVFALIVTAAGQVPAQDVDCTEKFLRHGAECTRPPGSPYGCQIWDILSYNSNREVAILSSSYSDNTFSARIESTDASGNKSVCVQTETLRLQEEWRISGTRMHFPRKSGHRVKPQDQECCNHAELNIPMLSDVFFGCKRFQCSKRGC
jgi:hypothetical protein